MKTVYVFFATTVALFIILNSCSFAPQSKDAYFDHFEAFVETVGESYKDYNADDWKRKDEQFSKYTDEWYLKFREEMSITNKITVKKLAVKYALYRNGDDLQGGIEEGIEALKEIGEEFLKILDDSTDDDTKIEITID